MGTISALDGDGRSSHQKKTPGEAKTDECKEECKKKETVCKYIVAVKDFFTLKKKD